jgi:LuxR family quorum sensing-dependent transcriptional regulator
MREAESYWGRRALDFVDAIEASATSASVVSQFEKMIGDLGFHAYIMVRLAVPDISSLPRPAAQPAP